jgi:transcriptional antiterminator Rof (Rho-off)
MNKKILKLKNLFIFYKSKFLKKKFLKEKRSLKILFKKQILKKNFNDLWFLNNIEIFDYFFPKKQKRFDYLEIGANEGLSLFYVLKNYKKVIATAIDLWKDKKKEFYFDKNLKEFNNYTKIKKDSIIALRELGSKNKKYDYVYVDGFHDGSHLIVDAIESYKLLKKNGIMIFDDALQNDKSLQYKFYQGVKNFLDFFRKEIKILYFQNILVIKKNI